MRSGSLGREQPAHDGRHPPHSLGVLELLSNQFYRNNKGERAWLHVQDLDDPDKFSSYPKHDPYEEISPVLTSRDTRA